MSTSSRVALPVMLLLGFVIAVAAIAISQSTDTASAAHTTTVPEQPRTDVPIVLDGTVYDIARIGHRVFVAGDFNEVELADGSIVEQKNLFAYDIDSGELIATFDPLVEGGSIRAIESTADGEHIVIAGSFTAVDGRFRNRVAKLDRHGEVDSLFVADVDAEVEAIALDADTMYLGGNFTMVNGAVRSRLGAVQLSDGALVADFDFPVTVGVGVGGTSTVKALDVSPDGQTLVAVYNALMIDGQNHGAVAQIDLAGTPTLNAWQTDVYSDGYTWCSGDYLRTRDMEIAPNGQYFVVVSAGHDAPPACDTAVAFPMVGGADVQPLWVTRMFDSTYSVGISDFAVYVGGHFCFTEGDNAPDYGFEIHPRYNKPAECQNGQTNGNSDEPPWVARRQIAALNPATGWALDWNPGSNADQAVYALEVIDRGVLLGQDTDRVNDVRTGRHALWDFGPVADNTAPTVAVTSPALDGDDGASAMTLAGTASDNYRVDSVSLRLYNVDTDQYLQTDGTLSSGSATVPADVGASDSTVDWSLDVVGLTAGVYQLDAKATDRAGNETAGWQRRTFVIDFSTPTCTVSLTENGNPDLDWTTVAGINTWSIRRDGSWLATVNNVFTWIDEGVAPGSYSYVVRYNDGGKIDIPCTPDPVVVDPPVDPPIVPTCTSFSNGLDVTLTWTDVAGEDSYSLRRNGKWIRDLGNVNTTVDQVPPGTYDYAIRFRLAGVTTDIDCGQVVVEDDTPPPTIECTATVVSLDVTLAWTAVPGENSYSMRRDGKWVRNLGDVTTTVDTGVSPGSHTYAIRYKLGGVTTDIACGQVTVVDDTPPPVIECTASVVGADVALTWTAVPGEDSYSLRRDGKWVRNLGDVTTTSDTGVAPGSHDYVIRYKQGGVTTDIPCGTITI